MKTQLLAAVLLAALSSSAAATSSEQMVTHRRAVRAEMASGGEKAAERFLKDADPGVRRYALACLYERNAAKGKAAAQKLRDDPDDAVKALARELTRERKAGRRAAPLPLSQNPANDHEVIRLKSVASEGESFTMPPKMACDEVEIWFGAQKQHLMVWVNDVLAAEYDPAVDGAREFRFDATKVVKWGCENKMWVTDERGKDKWLKFSVEVIKCGQ